MMNKSFTDNEIVDALKDWKSIVSKYQVPNTKKAILQIITSFVPFLIMWAAMYYSLSISYWITLGIALINAFFLVRIFIIQHDCGHSSFLKSNKWNRHIGFFCSFFSSIPFRYWARVHSFHHGHSGQLEVREVGDVPFLTVQEYKEAGKLKKFTYRVFRMPPVLFVVSPIVYFVFSNRFPVFNFKGWGDVIRSQNINNFLLLVVYILIAWIVGWKEFLLIQIPLILLFGIIAFWFFFVQHQHEHTYKTIKSEWDYVLASFKGATFYDIHKVFHWLTGDIGYHHIHHLSSRIPNYNLAVCASENPILMKYSYKLSFLDSLKCMNHKLWDPQSNRMISFKEAKSLY